MKKLIALLAVSLSVAPGVAEARFSKEQREACKADYQTFCANVPLGGGLIVKCLQQHSGELSPRCRALVEKRRSLRESCLTDYKKFCQSVMPGGGAIKKCLRRHEDQLTSSCRRALGGTGAGR